MCNFILIDIEDIIGNLNQLLWFLSSLFIQSLHQHDFYGIVRQGAHLNLVKIVQQLHSQAVHLPWPRLDSGRPCLYVFVYIYVVLVQHGELQNLWTIMESFD
jgi:hypothetical protein